MDEHDQERRGRKQVSLEKQFRRLSLEGQAAALNASLDALAVEDPRSAQTIILIIYHDIRVSDLTKVLNVSKSAVSKWKTRGLKRLRTLLSAEVEKAIKEEASRARREEWVEGSGEDMFFKHLRDEED